MSEQWTDRRERSNWLALRLLVWIVHRLGSRLARRLVWVVAVYFLLTAPGARRASRSYLSRVLRRPARWRDSCRHFYTYGAVSIDRINVHSGRANRLQVRVHGLDNFTYYRHRGRGALILVAHFGSFEALRALSERNRDVRLRILMDRAAGAKANAALAAIKADVDWQPIIDTSESDVDRVLRVKTALDRGEMVGLMADRFHPGERVVECDFLGGRASFPASPWLLASMTGAPVLLAFGAYCDGDGYDLYCEHFAERIDAPRARRMAAVQTHAQSYADRLARHVEAAPFNWFNFYEFWEQDAATPPAG